MLIFVLQILFWLCVLYIVHTYLLFPLIIGLIARLRKVQYSKVSDLHHSPQLTVLIPVYNEEGQIERRLRNIHEQTYDKNLFQVFVGSDASTDRTNETLQTCAHEYPWLRVFVFDERRGKAAVLNDLAAQAHSEILVFTDADEFFEEQSLQFLVQPFAREDVGGVAGMRLVHNASTREAIGVEEHSYYRYDNFIRSAEGRCGCIVGAHGGLFAIRSSVFQPLDVRKNYTDDFYFSMLPIAAGMKVTMVQEAVCHTQSAPTVRDEFNRKVRYSATAFATLARFSNLLFDRRLIMSYCLWSHRVCKWFFPFAMLSAFILNVLLVWTAPVYGYFLGFQLLIYGLALVGSIVTRFGVSTKIVTFSYYFVVSNAALFAGFFRFLMGKSSTIWQPSRS